MIDMGSELKQVREQIWKIRYYIGLDKFVTAKALILFPSSACDSIARFSNHLPLAQLKELNELSHQCIDILRYLDEQ